MNWEKLLCEKRKSKSKFNNKDLRNEFQKDYHRIIAVRHSDVCRTKLRYFRWIKAILCVQG